MIRLNIILINAGKELVDAIESLDEIKPNGFNPNFGHKLVLWQLFVIFAYKIVIDAAIALYNTRSSSFYVTSSLALNILCYLGTSVVAVLIQDIIRYSDIIILIYAVGVVRAKLDEVIGRLPRLSPFKLYQEVWSVAKRVAVLNDVLQPTIVVHLAAVFFKLTYALSKVISSVNSFGVQLDVSNTIVNYFCQLFGFIVLCELIPSKLDQLLEFYQKVLSAARIEANNSDNNSNNSNNLNNSNNFNNNSNITGFNRIHSNIYAVRRHKSTRSPGQNLIPEDELGYVEEVQYIAGGIGFKFCNLFIIRRQTLLGMLALIAQYVVILVQTKDL